MVALINSLARIIALTALVPFARGSALLRGRAVSTDQTLRGRAVSTDQTLRGRAVPTGQTWEEYDQTSVAFSQQGLCRHYWDTPTRPDVDGVTPCRQHCKTDEGSNYICKAGNSGDPSAFLMNPNGQRYSLGTCECDNTFVYHNNHGRRGGIEEVEQHHVRTVAADS